MDESRENRDTIGRDLTESAAGGLIEFSLDGVFEVVGDAMGDIAGSVIGGFFEGI